MKAMFDEMRAAGELRELDTMILSEAFLGMVNWVARWHRGQTGVSSLRATLLDLFVGGALLGDGDPLRRYPLAPPLDQT